MPERVACYLGGVRFAPTTGLNKALGIFGDTLLWVVGGEADLEAIADGFVDLSLAS